MWLPCWSSGAATGNGPMLYLAGRWGTEWRTDLAFTASSMRAEAGDVLQRAVFFFVVLVELLFYVFFSGKGGLFSFNHTRMPF